MATATTLNALRRGDLVGGRDLNLSHNGLTEFPAEIFGMADTLESLDLSGNALTRLPSDFTRLNKLKILFCSGNQFQHLPPVLGESPALTQLGFRNTGLREIPAEALPPEIRWLTLTDNKIERLPDTLGERPGLQKLMLAGNQLKKLPETLADASKLELLRLSANQFDELPPWLLRLPNLAWLAWAGNPLDAAVGPLAKAVKWETLKLGRLLGEGASGHVYEGHWRVQCQGVEPVAVKLFKGTMTSDGLPEREMAACLAAGDHPSLAGGLGQIDGHPEGAAGLVMPLLPAHWRPLAGPPSLDSCSRDIYNAGLKMGFDVAIRIAASIGEALSHLHGCGIVHGDAYAHNVIWDGDLGRAVLSDFGAASFIPMGYAGAGFERLEVLAWARLLGELLDHANESSHTSAIRSLSAACATPDVAARPTMAEALAELRTYTEGANMGPRTSSVSRLSG